VIPPDTANWERYATNEEGQVCKEENRTNLEVKSLVDVPSFVGVGDVDVSDEPPTGAVVEIPLGSPLPPPLEVDDNAVLELTGQAATWTLFASKVTSPPRANSPPLELDAVTIVIEAPARTAPLKWVAVPNVAELPICQYTLHARAVPCNKTVDPEAVVKAVPIWKYQEALVLEVLRRVKAPVSCAELLKL
jgi:hypothetical protein